MSLDLREFGHSEAFFKKPKNLDSLESYGESRLDSRDSFLGSSVDSKFDSRESHDAKSWLNALKIAIINAETSRAVDLIANLPEFSDSRDLESAHAIVGEFLAQLKREKSALARKIEDLKQARKFIT